MSTAVKKTTKSAAKKATAKKTTTAKKSTTRAKAVKTTVVHSAPAEQVVRARAFEIFMARGCEPGREMEDWFQAEQELRRN